MAKSKQLTDEQKKKYLASGGKGCPFCESDNIEGGHMEVDGSTAWQNVECHACNEQWQDIYSLTDVERICPTCNTICGGECDKKGKKKP